MTHFEFWYHVVAFLYIRAQRRLAITKDDAKRLYRRPYGTELAGLPGITDLGNPSGISHGAGHKKNATDGMKCDEQSAPLKITQRLSGPSRDTQYGDPAHLSLTQMHCDYEHITDVFIRSESNKIRKARRAFPREFPDKSTEKAEDSLIVVPSRTWVKTPGVANTFHEDRGDFTKKGTILRSRYSSSFVLRSALLQNMLQPKKWTAPTFETFYGDNSCWEETLPAKKVLVADDSLIPYKDWIANLGKEHARDNETSIGRFSQLLPPHVGDFSKWPNAEHPFKRVDSVMGRQVGPLEAYIRVEVATKYKSWTDAEWEALTPEQRKVAMTELSGFTCQLASEREALDSNEIVSWRPREYAPYQTRSAVTSSTHGFEQATRTQTPKQIFWEWLHTILVRSAAMRARSLGEWIHQYKDTTQGPSIPLSPDPIVLHASQVDGRYQFPPNDPCNFITHCPETFRIAHVTDKYHEKRDREDERRKYTEEDQCVRLTMNDGTHWYWFKSDVETHPKSNPHYPQQVLNVLHAMARYKPKLKRVTKKFWVVVFSTSNLPSITLSDNGLIRTSEHYKYGSVVSTLSWTEALTHCHLSIRHGDPSLRDFWEGCAAVCRKAGGTTAPGFVLDQPKKGDVLKQPRDKLVQIGEGFIPKLDHVLWGEQTTWEEEEWQQQVLEKGTSSEEVFHMEDALDETELETDHTQEEI